jgi:hypothetical protein
MCNVWFSYAVTIGCHRPRVSTGNSKALHGGEYRLCPVLVLRFHGLIPETTVIQPPSPAVPASSSTDQSHLKYIAEVR